MHDESRLLFKKYDPNILFLFYRKVLNAAGLVTVPSVLLYKFGNSVVHAASGIDTTGWMAEPVTDVDTLEQVFTLFTKQYDVFMT